MGNCFNAQRMENTNYTANNQFITKLCCNNLLCRPEFVGYLDCNTERHTKRTLFKEEM